MDVLQDAYNNYIRHLFTVFVNEITSDQDIDKATARFKTGIEIANKALEKAKEIIAI